MSYFILNDVSDKVTILDCESQRYPHIDRLSQNPQCGWQNRQIVDELPAVITAGKCFADHQTI